MAVLDVDVNGNPVGRGFDLSDLPKGWLEYPWVRRAVNSYADRMRVDNFTPAGNVMFQAMLRKALLGIPVFFIMQSNGRESKVSEEKVPVIPATGKSFSLGVSNENASDSTEENMQYTVTKRIQSGRDPVDVKCFQNPPERLKDVCYVGYNGKCYDSDGAVIEGFFCIYLISPPITQSAVDIAIGAQKFDNLTFSAMKNITIPQSYISGVDTTAQIRNKNGNEDADSSNGEDSDSKLNPVIVPHPGDPNSRSLIPSIGILSQWDSQKMFAYQQSKAIEFIGETKVPPVDFPETNALGQTAQSLVSNREPFVSRVATIKEQVGAVFDSAGIPELSWQLIFPYTPQDIASIGDAAGKGVTSSTLKNYGSGLA